MHTNEQLITTFYTAFQQKDYATMQSCYADDAKFSDPVFQNLNAKEVKAMWQMLITRGKDLQLTFSDITANDTSGTAKWEAAYTFTATGNKVLNKIKANFILKDGKITEHIDDFDFYIWAKQALGLKGLLLGWTGFLKNKVRQGARKNLEKFMH